MFKLKGNKVYYRGELILQVDDTCKDTRMLDDTTFKIKEFKEWMDKIVVVDYDNKHYQVEIVELVKRD